MSDSPPPQRSAVQSVDEPLAQQRRRRRKRYNNGVKVFRRVHMYFGLVLTPFVLLYGVTALLFNHPSWLSTTEIEMIDSAELGFDGLGDPGAAAAHAIEVLNEASDREIVLDPSREVSFTGTIVIDARTESGSARYRVPADGGPAQIGRTVSASGGRSLEIEEIEPEPGAAAEVGSLIRGVAGHAGVRRLNVRSVPDVEFGALVDGEPWVVSVDARDGEVSARPVDQPSRPLSIRGYVLRLHTAHTYPDEASTRWVWAVIVDVIGVLMIFWALSGLIMWWQMKPMRRWGAVATGGGLVLAGVLGYAMFRAIFF
ncbi:MAG: PepSY domain-containing protein [Planctomycetota bacterium]